MLALELAGQKDFFDGTLVHAGLPHMWNCSFSQIKSFQNFKITELGKPLEDDSI